jgi:hypothetical protein
MISVVGFRSHACWCRKCKQVHYAPVDEATRRAGLVGPRLTGLIAYLKGACHCSYSTIAKFIRDVLHIRLSSDNYSSPSTTTIIPDLPSIAANVNDNYFSRSAGQLILPGRSVARYGSRAG